MRATELYNLLEQNKEKLTLIDQIQEFDAAKGLSLGWAFDYSEHKEGDWPEWDIEVLIKIPYYLLQKTLAQWTEEQEHILPKRD